MVRGAAASGGPMTYACADNESWNFKTVQWEPDLTTLKGPEIFGR